MWNFPSYVCERGFAVNLTLESKVICIIFVSVTLVVSLSNDLKLSLGPAGMFRLKGLCPVSDE
jgi:hypothetical protein